MPAVVAIPGQDSLNVARSHNSHPGEVDLRRYRYPYSTRVVDEMNSCYLVARCQYLTAAMIFERRNVILWYFLLPTRVLNPSEERECFREPQG